MRILLLLCLILSVASYGQDLSKIFPLKDGKVYYEKLIDVEGVTKDQLYSRAKAWAITHYGSQKEASQADDRDLGMLVYNGYFTEDQENPKTWGVKTTTTFQFWHNLKVYVKEGKAKIVIDKVQLGSSVVPSARMDIENSLHNLPKSWKEKYEAKTLETYGIANTEFLKTIDNLSDALKKKSEADF